jgi:3-oxocholest-4-en-26-oate---CoA ligase
LAGWNFADVFDAAADCIGSRTALVHGDREVTWNDFEARAAAIAVDLMRAGLTGQSRVALALFNGPEYLEATYAAFKAGVTPMNTNYRYVGDELVHLWTDAQVEAVIFSSSLAATISDIRTEIGFVKRWLVVDDGSGCPPWATPYEAVATNTPVCAPGWPERSGDDLLLLYTGGTTGLPKGVMWRQDDLYTLFSDRDWRDPLEQDLDRVRARLATQPGPVWLVASPLMHGTGWFCALQALCRGGTVITLPGRSFDVQALLDTMSGRHATALTIVGDAFCRPIVDLLTEAPGRWDLTTLRLVYSSGVTWSDAVKRRLLEHCPDATLVDILSSSEAIGLGTSVMRVGDMSSGARFRVGQHARVIDDGGRDLIPGSGAIGRIAVAGRVPLGYLNDAAKSAQTFVELDGSRYSIPGDMATIEADGTITLLGRGSLCINTAGEKVYPEEVESCIRTHPRVRDVAVVGVPDPRWGEIVTAAVVADDVEAGDLVEHIRGKLAPYKVPRRVHYFVDLNRLPNGKADYLSIRNRCLELGMTQPRDSAS